MAFLKPKYICKSFASTRTQRRPSFAEARKDARANRLPAMLCAMIGTTLWGCGDGLTDADYRGTPLWRMSGGLEQSSFDTSAYPTVRIALFWNPSGETPRPASQLVEQTSASQSVAVGNPYILNMFDLPGADHIARTYDGRSRGFGIGRVLGYADLDANGRYSDGDKFVSLWSDVALFYAASDLPSWASPTSGALSAGFYQLLLPQRCDKPIPTPTDSGTCGITLGKKCGTDADCGTGGTCLRETNIPWPTGYCAVANTPSASCRPAAAAYYGIPQDIPNPPTARGYYLKPCQSDQDCVTQTQRDAGVYRCDLGLFACTPSVGGKMSVGGIRDIEAELTRQPFCMTN